MLLHDIPKELVGFRSPYFWGSYGQRCSYTHCAVQDYHHRCASVFLGVRDTIFCECENCHRRGTALDHYFDSIGHSNWICLDCHVGNHPIGPTYEQSLTQPQLTGR